MKILLFILCVLLSGVSLYYFLAYRELKNAKVIAVFKNKEVQSATFGGKEMGKIKEGEAVIFYSKE